MKNEEKDLATVYMDKNAEAAEKNREMGMPPLVGSEKQVGWAESLRFRLYNVLCSYVEQLRRDVEKMDMSQQRKEFVIGAAISAVARIYANDDAKWWINNRRKVASKVSSAVTYAFRYKDQSSSDDAVPDYARKWHATSRVSQQTVAIAGTCYQDHVDPDDGLVRSVYLTEGTWYRMIRGDWYYCDERKE